MISVLIADTDQDFTKETGWALSSTTEIRFHTVTTDFTELESLVTAHEANILLIGPSWGNRLISNLIAPLLKKFSSLNLVCPSKSSEENLDLIKLAKDGIDSQRIKTINFPVSRAEVVEAIKEIYAYSKNPASEAEQESCQKGEPQNLQEKLDQDSKGKLITVFSTKGGVGKTVIATNLAVCLAQRFPSDVVILDLDFQFGDFISLSFSQIVTEKFVLFIGINFF